MGAQFIGLGWDLTVGIAVGPRVLPLQSVDAWLYKKNLNSINR